MLYFLTGLRRLKQQSSILTTIEPTVSVIIAARNEEDNIGNLLEDLIEQSYSKKKIEIIISEDRSTDRTSEIIDNYTIKYDFISCVKIKKLSEKMTPKKNALTKAIEISSGDIIISTDADCRVSPNWIKSIVQQFDEKTGVIIGYSKIDTISDSIFNNYQAVDFLALMSANAGTLGWGIPWTGSGQNIAYQRSAFDKIDGFKPVADQVSGDDFYLMQAISNISKARYNANPEGFVTTKPMNSIRTFISQRTRWASNTRKLFNSNFFFLLFLFMNLFANTIILCGLFFKPYWQYIPMLLGTKFLFDSLVLFYGSNLFKTPLNIGAYIFWSIAQPLYTPVLAIFSMVGKFRWKD
jgi:cellulose synthase/poly-beta-1,6-N-acetylglucosamine synthase-like glycosyltransferase